MHKCWKCFKMSRKAHKVNGSPWFCYDGCYSTTGIDRRTVNGKPMWEGNKLISEEYRGAEGGVKA